MITAKTKFDAATKALAEADALFKAAREIDANGDPCYRIFLEGAGVDVGAVVEAITPLGLACRFDSVLHIEDPNAVTAAEEKADQIRADAEQARADAERARVEAEAAASK